MTDSRDESHSERWAREEWEWAEQETRLLSAAMSRFFQAEEPHEAMVYADAIQKVDWARLAVARRTKRALMEIESRRLREVMMLHYAQIPLAHTDSTDDAIPVPLAVDKT